MFQPRVPNMSPPTLSLPTCVHQTGYRSLFGLSLSDVTDTICYREPNLPTLMTTRILSSHYEPNFRSLNQIPVKRKGSLRNGTEHAPTSIDHARSMCHYCTSIISTLDEGTIPSPTSPKQTFVRVRLLWQACVLNGIGLDSISGSRAFC